MHTINIAKDFHPIPGGRYRSDGPYSGQQFREDYLVPALLERTTKILVDFNGVLGSGCSFLDGAFGGLRSHGFTQKELNARLVIVSDDPTIGLLVGRYIQGE
jgi:hypothetical protein